MNPHHQAQPPPIIPPGGGNAGQANFNMPTGPINPMEPMLNTPPVPNMGGQGAQPGHPFPPMPMNQGPVVNMPIPSVIGPPLANPSAQAVPIGGPPHIAPYPVGPNMLGPQAMVPPNPLQQNIVLAPNRGLNLAIDVPPNPLQQNIVLAPNRGLNMAIDFSDESDDELDIMVMPPPRPRRMRAPIPQAGLVGPVIPSPGFRGANSLGMLPMTPMSQLLPNSPYNLVDPQLQLPYSYAYTQLPIANYPEMVDDIAVLSTVLQRMDGDIRGYIDVLVDKSPTEVDALRREFRNISRGTDLHIAFSNLLRTRVETASVEAAFLSLVLGPVLYDLWILQGNFGEHEDLLIDIFVGRNPDDIRVLSLKYQQQQNLSFGSQSLAAAVEGFTTSNEIRFAVSVCSDGTRRRPSMAVDNALVVRDVQEIIEFMDETDPDYQKLLDILLRRDDQHIRQIDMMFRTRTGFQLDAAIRQSRRLTKMTKKIAVHALRTAVNVIYRDAMLLREAMGTNTSPRIEVDRKLGIRVCRMHWYFQHWRQVQAVFLNVTGRNFADLMMTRNGLFRDLMLCMTQILRTFSSSYHVL